MSSVNSIISQVPANKFYIVGAGGGKIYDVAGGNATTISTAGTILRDMGKTVKIGAGADTLLRKVQILPVANTATISGYEYQTGYIYLNPTSATLGATQNITTLN